MSAPKIRVADLTKRFGDILALDRVSFDVAAGEIVCLLGPSGCGKSTCLHIIAGFDRPTEGVVEVDGQPIRRPGPERSVVFQTDALFPWMTVWENVTLGPRTRKLFGIDRDAKAMLEEVGLSGFGDRYPYELSGGMRQRVAIARALLNRPDVLLMDEPFGALDAQTRLSMQELILSISARHKPTILFVTHDIDEALFLGHRVLVMSARPGRIAQVFPIEAAQPRRYDFLTSSAFNEKKKAILDLFHRVPEFRHASLGGAEAGPPDGAIMGCDRASAPIE